MTYADEVRARIRAIATVAFDAVPAVWPIGGFVATNPLSGFEHRPFAAAIDAVEAQTGARGYLSEVEYRARYADGRITAAAFEAALRVALDTLPNENRVMCGRSLSVHDIVRISLLTDVRSRDERSPLDSAAASRVPLGPSARSDASAAEPLASAAGKTLGEFVDALCDSNIVALVNERTITWCSAFLDEGEATWSMPYRSLGFYAAWRRLAPYESHSLRSSSGSRDVRVRRLQTFDRPEDAIAAALCALGVESSLWEAYLRRHALELPGWAGVAKWRATNAYDPAKQVAAIDPAQYLAVRLSYEAAFVETIAARYGIAPTEAEFRALVGEARVRPVMQPDASARTVLTNLAAAFAFSATDVLALTDDDLRWLLETEALLTVNQRSYVWLRASEGTVRSELLNAIQHRTAPSTVAPTVDVVCCIDVRSEGLRRYLESVGPYRTRGFAGFYGLPIALQSIGSDWSQPACPVLLTPKHRIVEYSTTQVGRAKRHARARSFLSNVRRVLDELKGNAASAFVLFEAIGLIFTLPLAGRTLMPDLFARCTAALRRAVVPDIETAFVVEKTAGLDEAVGFTSAERLFFAESALALMAMRDDFARLVLLVGHGSTTENNPFEASLDCGACAGYRGGPNARILASLLNREDVRTGLVARGISIPTSTVFIAGEHDTALDRVYVYDEHLVPNSHRAELATLQRDLGIAGSRLAGERIRALDPHDRSHAAAHVATRAADWAQVRPEWGLARNAVFVIAPRSFTVGADLGCRAFMHEYDVDRDADGALLEIIMTAPLVVAQWINNHYYFATVDNERYGSGSKVIHNVVGRIGVMAGNRSDLRAGLPLQSLADSKGWYHEPVRLLAIVTAPRARIEAVIGRHEILRRLFHNEWIALTAWDPASAQFWNYLSTGAWEPHSSSAATETDPIPSRLTHV